MMEAIRLWEDIDTELGGSTGFVRTGTTYLASSEQELSDMSDWLSIAKANGLKSSNLSSSQIDTLVDRPSGYQKHKWAGGIHTASDARAEPWKAVPAVARLAQKEGARIRENCAVRTLASHDGQVRAVYTESGKISTNHVVLAGGAWSSLFCQRHGISIPQLSIKATVARTAQLPDFHSGCAVDEQFAFRRREDGGYTIAVADNQEFYLGPDALRHSKHYLPVAKRSFKATTLRWVAPTGFPDQWRVSRSWGRDEKSPFETTRVLDPEPNMKSIARAQDLFAKRFPDVGRPKILDSCAGMVDAMPDVVPIVDKHPQFEGFVIATGMSGHGFGIGPGIGKAVANLVVGNPTGHDLARFRFARFTDGSLLKLGPGL
ncbi:MAG: NAD(P)/FAD-dependent oxidoreductase [Pelagimonas sp.]|uniref:NAD(P)/FAD-dependent oxidoreductase n=1 Tax=Pelagimonas sp. TaxID=2073170 RepID=UPI003D6B8B87